jgi:excisionase family DNA binding protein
METLTTKEVAERLGVTVPRVHALIRTGRLPAEKRGRDVFIKESDLKLVQDRKAGRPPNVTSAANKRATRHVRAKEEASTGKKRGGNRQA